MNYCTPLQKSQTLNLWNTKKYCKSQAYTRVSKYSIFPSISCLMNDSVQTNVHTNFLREGVWITALLCRKVKPWIYEILKSTVNLKHIPGFLNIQFSPWSVALWMIQCNLTYTPISLHIWITALFRRKVKLCELLTWCF